MLSISIVHRNPFFFLPKVPAHVSAVNLGGGDNGWRAPMVSTVIGDTRHKSLSFWFLDLFWGCWLVSWEIQPERHTSSSYTVNERPHSSRRIWRRLSMKSSAKDLSVLQWLWSNTCSTSAVGIMWASRGSSRGTCSKIVPCRLLWLFVAGNNLLSCGSLSKSNCKGSEQRKSIWRHSRFFQTTLNSFMVSRCSVSKVMWRYTQTVVIISKKPTLLNIALAVQYFAVTKSCGRPRFSCHASLWPHFARTPQFRFTPCYVQRISF